MKALFLSLAVVALGAMTACGNKEAQKEVPADPQQAVLDETVEANQTVVDEDPAEEAVVAALEFNKMDGIADVLAPVVKMTPGTPVVIDFNATWCGPCKMFGPTFEAAAEKYAGKALFAEVDVDNYPEIANKFGVESIPMVVYINSNGEYAYTIGLLDETEFEGFLQQIL